MTKSELFKTAHAKAQSIVNIVGDYKIAFQFALKNIYKSICRKIVKMIGSEKQINFAKDIISKWSVQIDEYQTPKTVEVLTNENDDDFFPDTETISTPEHAIVAIKHIFDCVKKMNNAPEIIDNCEYTAFGLIRIVAQIANKHKSCQSIKDLRLLEMFPDCDFTVVKLLNI